jgi:hypothetical protein
MPGDFSAGGTGGTGDMLAVVGVWRMGMRISDGPGDGRT